MKQLNREDLARIVRELDDTPTLVRWLLDSREENRVMLEEAPMQDLPAIQGENKSLNQILDKVPQA